MNNLYRILGVLETASEEEIKKAYKSLSKKYHPDVNPGDRDAEAHFREVADAYAILQNPQKRREYDRKLKESENGKEKFFHFRPKTGGQCQENTHEDGKTRTNPIDMTEMFERYMGIRK